MANITNQTYHKQNITDNSGVFSFVSDGEVLQNKKTNVKEYFFLIFENKLISH